MSRPESIVALMAILAFYTLLLGLAFELRGVVVDILEQARLALTIGH